MGFCEGDEIRIIQNGQVISCGKVVDISFMSDVPDEIPAEPLNKTFEISGIVTNVNGIDHFFTKFFFSKKEIKRLFYDVTHGFQITFYLPVEYKGHIERVERTIDRPSRLRKFLSNISKIKLDYKIIKQ